MVKALSHHRGRRAQPRPRQAPAGKDRGPAQSSPGERAAARPGAGGGDGPLTYDGYLQLDALRALQLPQADPPVHDEMLFITVHQVYELWFAQLLHELEAARDVMLEGVCWRAAHLLRRVHVIDRLMIAQIDVLETMAPQDFGEFRCALGPASGFQSVQFRELEFLSGAKDERFLDRIRGLTGPARRRLRQRLAEPTLWDAYLALLHARGLRSGSDEEVLFSLRAAASDRATHDDLWQVAECLLTHDELAGMWRARHVQLVERQIGAKPGTGGSAGAAYLRSRVPVRYYPLLWELRLRL